MVNVLYNVHLFNRPEGKMLIAGFGKILGPLLMIGFIYAEWCCYAKAKRWISEKGGMYGELFLLHGHVLVVSLLISWVIVTKCPVRPGTELFVMAICLAAGSWFMTMAALKRKSYVLATATSIAGFSPFVGGLALSIGRGFFDNYFGYGLFVVTILMAIPLGRSFTKLISPLYLLRQRLAMLVLVLFLCGGCMASYAVFVGVIKVVYGIF